MQGNVAHVGVVLQRPILAVGELAIQLRTGAGNAGHVGHVLISGNTGYNGRGGQKSTGLGLYLVHQTAEMLHCRVSLSSRIGEGTSVTIDLHQEELGKE